MALTKVTEGVRTLGTGEVATANMATDPTNASNLSSGSVPTAQLGNVDLTPLEDDIALLGFKVATNGSLAKYDLVDQTQDVFEDASGIDASASTNEYRNTSKYYSGTAAAPTGGTITTYTSGSDYIVHSFLSSGDFVTTVDGNVDYLIVAGGGAGGGGDIPGGGGAGGLLTAAALATTAQTYAVVVGDGGVWNDTSSDNNVTKNGGNSSAFGLTAIGGGGGGNGSGGTAAIGGSGGGWHGYNSNRPGSGQDGTGTAGQGNTGGMGQGSPNYGAGGGGGAGGVGDNGGSPNKYGGDGGVGLENAYRTGSNVFYAGGGGGWGYDSWPGGLGGNGGGGNAGPTNVRDPEVGDPNSGGGGGASEGTPVPGTGGSGIVVIRFVDGTLNPVSDMTLISNATTAESVPTKGDMVMTYTNGAGTATINTDIKAYVSRDNGTTYTQLTLADQGDTGGHTILTAHDLDISSQPSGSAMRYKITTHNQSVSKETRVQAVSLGWS
jgi:hypothetical protein